MQEGGQNAGRKAKYGISRTIAGWLTPIMDVLNTPFTLALL